MSLLIVILSLIIVIFPSIASCKTDSWKPQKVDLKKIENRSTSDAKKTKSYPSLNNTCKNKKLKNHNNLDIRCIQSLINHDDETKYETRKVQTDMVFEGLAQASDLIGNNQKKEKKRMIFSLVSLLLRLAAQMAKKTTRSIECYDPEVQIILDQIVSIIENNKVNM